MLILSNVMCHNDRIIETLKKGDEDGIYIFVKSILPVFGETQIFSSQIKSKGQFLSFVQCGCVVPVRRKTAVTLYHIFILFY